jgi:hypothetical protein
MSNRPFILIAVVVWLIALALGIAFAGLQSDYTPYRDGDHVVGHVTEVEPHRTYVRVEIVYDRGGTLAQTTAYPPIKQAAAFQPGAPVDLLVAPHRGVMRASELDAKRPPLVLLIGAIAALLAGFAALIAHYRLRFRRGERRERIEIIVEAVARTRNLRLAGGVLFVLIAAAFALVPLADREGTTGEILGIEALAAVTLATAGWLAWLGLRLRDLRRNPIVDLVERRPQDIAWTHIRQQQSRGMTFLMVMIWKVDRRSECLRVLANDADAVLAEIAQRAPHAAIGFSPETQRLYRADPKRWRRAASA